MTRATAGGRADRIVCIALQSWWTSILQIILSTEIEQTFGNISQSGEKLLARFSRVPLKYAEIIFDQSATGFWATETKKACLIMWTEILLIEITLPNSGNSLTVSVKIRLKHFGRFLKKGFQTTQLFFRYSKWFTDPFFRSTLTETGSVHPFTVKNLKFQWTIYSGRECNELYNKNSVYVISELHLRRLSCWCLI